MNMTEAESQENGSEETSDPKSRPSMLWLLVGAGALALGTGTMFAAGQSSGVAVASERIEAPTLVEATRLVPSDNTFTVRAPGRLQPRQELTLVGEVQGKIIEINPDLTLGGRIDEGDIVLRIDPGDFTADQSRAKAQVATAEARLAQVQAERDRQIRLADLGAAPEKQREAAIAAFKDAQASLEQAQAQLNISRRNVGRSVIRAPFDAIVTSESVTLGSFVAPGARLATLIDASEGELVAGLKPDDVRAVRSALGQSDNERLTVRAVPNSGSIGGKPLVGYLEKFSPVIDPQSRTVSVVAVFPDAFSEDNDGEVFAGDFMTLEIDALSSEPLFELPEGTVRQDSFVWVVDEGDVIHRRRVHPIDRRDGRVLIASSEFDGDERVMTTVLAEEIEGMKVRVDGEDQ